MKTITQNYLRKLTLEALDNQAQKDAEIAEQVLEELLQKAETAAAQGYNHVSMPYIFTEKAGNWLYWELTNRGLMTFFIEDRVEIWW